MRNLFLAVPAALLAFATPASAFADSAKPAPNPDKLICKRETVIGTLAGGRKVCHTRAEWQAMRNDAQRDAQSMQNLPGAQGPN